MPTDCDCLLCQFESVLRRGLVSEEERMDLLSTIEEIREQASKPPKVPPTDLADFLEK